MSKLLILDNPKHIIQPTRDNIINVQSNFCNLRDDDDIPIFTEFITSLIFHGMISKFEDWMQRLDNVGSTHIDIGLTASYDENLGWINQYPIPDGNWSNDIIVVRDALDAIIEHGKIPHLHLNWDDFGLDWGFRNLPNIINQLVDYIPKILWDTGYDGCFPSWNRNQFISALYFLRHLLGPNGQIATEFAGPGGPLPYIDLGQGQGDYDGPLQELDVLLLEYGTGQFDNKCGMQQQLTRLFGPRYPKPLIPGCDDHSGVYYLSAPRKRGILGVCAYEWVWGGAFNQIRKLNVPADAVTIANGFKDYGFTSFGNGQPNA